VKDLFSWIGVWALELGLHGITANAVRPGPIRTALFDRANPSDSQRTKAIVEGIRACRMGTPEDAANAVSFVLDSRSGFVTVGCPMSALA
jgi:3-oxoacyl-[acyl-carrier protein] reductase